MASILKNLNWRYATKRMNGKRVPDEKLDNILEAIRLAPSSQGLQPYTVFVVGDQSVKEKLAPAINNQPQIIQGSHVLVFAAWENYSSEKLDDYIENIAKQRQESTESLAEYRKRLENSIARRTPEQLLAWNQRQVYISLGIGLLAAAHEEVDATPMEGFDPDALDEALGLKEKGLRSTVILTLGYRDEANDPLSKKAKVRRPKQELYRYI